MMKMRGHSEAALRFAERRQREKDAPRLLDRVPTLTSLRLDIVASRGETSSDPKHTRIIQVGSAPALFSFTCADHTCRDGGHDMTLAMMRPLMAGQTHFTLDDTCYGTIGMAPCNRTLHIEVHATYRS